MLSGDMRTVGFIGLGQRGVTVAGCFLAAGGADGILAGLDTAKLWVDLSTVSPSAGRELAGVNVRDIAVPAARR
jgi:3-hydroxyisobutyrate dehydrogenase-like beta-hydroxyacid dehydrogenase